MVVFDRALDLGSLLHLGSGVMSTGMNNRTNDQGITLGVVIFSVYGIIRFFCWLFS